LITREHLGYKSLKRTPNRTIPAFVATTKQ
jgi:hypothetical protein